MGWKNIKEHYRIGHTVQVAPPGIAIGTSHLPDLLVITPEGNVYKPYPELSSSAIDELHRVLQADKKTLLQLMAAPDTFERSSPVYTYEGGEVLEKFCEEPGWPNLTHDGLLMYENTFSTDKASIVKAAKNQSALELNHYKSKRDKLRKELAEMEAIIETQEAAVRKLDADYPESN